MDGVRIRHTMMVEGRWWDYLGVRTITGSLRKGVRGLA